MDKYEREPEQKSEEKSKPIDNEIRVTTTGKMRSYITYATKKLEDDKCEEITLKAMGKAINKTVSIAEIIKRRIPNLHQITQIDSTIIEEKYNPNEEGLDTVHTTRHVSSILITLYTREPDTKSVGYQPPIPEAEVRPTPNRNPSFSNQTRPAARRGRMNRRRGRGRRGGNTRPNQTQDQQQQEAQSQTTPQQPSQSQQQSQPQQSQPQQSQSSQQSQQTTQQQSQYSGPGRRGRGGRGRGGRRGRGRGRGRGGRNIGGAQGQGQAPRNNTQKF
jgi:DNA-binding protein Alba